jgi:Na+:H+ antiporter, NhaA family
MASRRSTVPLIADRVLQPFQRFAEWKPSGGVVLMVCATVALLLANSSFGPAMERLWETPLSIGLAAQPLTLSLRTWINDALMAVFFLLVGLEIKRELLVGDLSSVRSAVLPLSAALGGMMVPAAIYAALNAGTVGERGWAIPMATDIAFALGVLATLGTRVPPGLTVFLAALAIADDLGAVLVIALFYGHAPSADALLLVCAAFGALVALNVSGFRRPIAYLLIGIVLWYAVLMSGIHATVAGVLLAITIPARSRIEPGEFVEETEEYLSAFRNAGNDAQDTVLSNDGQQRAITAIEGSCELSLPPLVRLQHGLHTPVNFFIMPVFALANAGILLRANDGATAAVQLPVTTMSSMVLTGVALGLVLGKPLGILAGTVAALRLGAVLPKGVRWAHVLGAACLGGVGFTMSLFLAALAFPGGGALNQAKLGIVIGSSISAVIGVLILLLAARQKAPAETHRLAQVLAEPEAIVD